MKRVFIIFLVLISCQEKQQKESILNDCLTTEQVSLLNKMISSFENDVCRYYNLPKDETDKSIINYLNEIKAMSENSSEEVSIVLKIASNKSKQLLKDSFDILSDDVWISYEEENNSKGIMNSYEHNALEKFKIDTVDAQEVDSLILEDDFEIVDIPILEKGEVLKDRLEKDSIDREEMIKKYRNKHYLRIYGKLVDCIYKKTKNETARKLYDALLASGRISPLLFIDGLTKDINSTEIKIYVALSLFYSPLDFELN